MVENRRRVFIKTDLVREIDQFPQADLGHFLAQPGSVPLYVMMHLGNPAMSAVEAELLSPNTMVLPSGQELEELSTDDDGDLIKHLESRPDLFRATAFELEDGSAAIAYDFAKPRLFSMHRVKDEADWRVVMKTFDPTWLSGPAVRTRRRFNVPRKKPGGAAE
jgi:hypothetical protein